jgi:hypothetical protein
VGIFDADPGLDSRPPDAVGEQPSGYRQRQAGQLIGCPSDNVRGATSSRRQQELVCSSEPFCAGELLPND